MERKIIIPFVMILLSLYFYITDVQHSIYLFTTQQVRVVGGKGENAECNGRGRGRRVGKE